MLGQRLTLTEWQLKACVLNKVWHVLSAIDRFTSHIKLHLKTKEYVSASMNDINLTLYKLVKSQDVCTGLKIGHV